MSHPSRHDDARGPDRKGPPGPTERDAPEREAPEEALLLSEWAAEVPEADELPQEILGLLDGTLTGEEAERARARLAADPSLARAAGELVAAWRDLSAAPGAEVPAALHREALDLVPVSRRPETRRGFLARLLEWTRIPAAPGFAAAAAVVLLIGFVLMERERAPLRTEAPSLRSTPAPQGAIALVSPAADARVTGDLAMRWEAVPGAARYRVVLVDAGDGSVAEAGHTEGTELTAPAAELARRFEGDGPHALHWIVRARLLDGTEVSSGPRRVTWSAR